MDIEMQDTSKSTNNTPSTIFHQKHSRKPNVIIRPPDVISSSANKQKIWGQKIEHFLIKLTLSTAIKIFKFAAFIKCVPFELTDNESLRVQMFPQKWKRILWQIATWIIIFMSIFKCLNFLVIVGKIEFGSEVAIHIFHIITSTLYLVFNTSLYLKPDECVFMLNQHDFIFRVSQDLGMGSRHWASHPIVMIAVVYFSRMQILLGISAFIMLLWRPNYSAHLYSVFPESWKGNYGLLVACTGLEVCWTAWGLTTLLLFFCYWVAIIFTVNTALETLRKKIELTAKDIQAYLYLQIFMVLFNDFNGSFFTPGFYTTITAAPILFIFLTLTTFDSVNIFIFLCFPVSALFCIFLIIYFLPQHSKIAIFSKALLMGLEKRRIVGSMNSRYGERSKVVMLSTLYDVQYRSPIDRGEYLKKRVVAFRRMGVRNSFFGYCSLSTSDVMMEQLCNNLILLLSLL